jgi:hypothetical protein
MVRMWSMPIDLDDPEDRQVATWLAAQPSPAQAVKTLIRKAEAGQEPSDRWLKLVPYILREVRALRAELNQVQAGGPSDALHEEVLYELRALRADLARVGPKELGKVTPPPEDPESAQRLDALFHRR